MRETRTLTSFNVTTVRALTRLNALLGTAAVRREEARSVRATGGNMVVLG
jgi:hypothetical protein